jgi:hypothetical protein
MASAILSLSCEAHAYTVAELIRVLPDANQDAATVYEVVKPYILSDPEAGALLSRANQVLQLHNIKNVGAILSYCPKSFDAGELGAFEFAGHYTAEVRYHFRGAQADFWVPYLAPWSQGALDEAKNAYFYRVLELPSLDVLQIVQEPQICIRKGLPLHTFASTLIHEIVHFLNLNPFKSDDVIDNHLEYSSFVEDQINQRGGELEAFKAEVSFQIRLLAPTGTTVAGRDEVGFDGAGNLVNPTLLKNYLLKGYLVAEKPAFKALGERRYEALNSELRMVANSQLPAVIKANANQNHLLDPTIDELNERVLELRNQIREMEASQALTKSH